ncbi:conserved hypothetical protein [Uncinocarpus reesii 1704]|uniref:DUF1996 domain-containing protein n=1 Tax=Uncinocarpus reesii (strain UAMH 1704) TaxID=336963 RepID=C4JM82_UNCRE|nr:uncharacterized protein UREG_03940 [Uncinocarpus reesii 1704]EEP79094.1 conserved hypothetical protein [Uncinocarpus reesii 1704]
MRFNPSHLAAIAVSLITLMAPVMGFWRLPCRGVLTVARIDPIVDPGIPSMHAHSIHGPNNFAMEVTSDDLLASECTSCEVVQDKSAYWTPSLYFINPSGEAELVKQVGGMLVYYLPRGDNVQAFPRGFRMLAGDTYQRNFTLPTPDPPKAVWAEKDKTQFSLGQKAIGFNCLNYDNPPEPSLMRHNFPDRAFIDSKCKDGIRMELVFPSCWNGKDIDSPDHMSHVAYPDLVDVGSCPNGFEKRLVTLMYETIWDTMAFKGQAGEFVLSNGDPTGYGYHGDFIEAWENDVLQRAIDTCTNLSGRVEDCPLFQLQSEDDQRKCTIENPKALGGERYDFNPEGLPGKVPIIRGPGYALRPISSPSAPETMPKPVVPDPKVKLPQDDQPVVPRPETTTAPPPPTTPAPKTPGMVSEKPKLEQPYTTSYSTKGSTIYEIVIIRTTVTKTVDLPSPTAQAKRHENRSGVKGRFRRHGHALNH